MGTLKVNGDIIANGHITASSFLGNATSASILALYDSSNGSSTSIGSWEPTFGYITVYKQLWKNSNLNNDTGDLVLQLRNNNGGTELCMIIDGDYYSMGHKVLNEGNYFSYALPLTGGTMSGTIWSNHVYPKTTMSYNFGSTDYEYNATFSRTVFVRHLEPAKNVNEDIYINHGSRNGCIRAYTALSMEGIGNIVNLPIEGGLYWNPYVESAEDGSDAASITLHANGVGGGTELRITMANDGNDVINLNPASWIYLQGKAAFRVDDSWLRINETRGFSSGVYFGGSLVRTDSCLQVGDSGTAFGAYNDGTGYFANHLNIGSHVSIWSDGEGGNITLRNPSNGNNIFQFDRCFADGLRLYSSLDGGASGTAEWAFYNDGRFQTSRIIGTDYGYGLRVQSLNRGNGAGWTEGIWIEPADSGYATLALGKTDRSSVVALVHHNNGHDHYLEKKNSRGQWTYLLPEASGELLNAGNYANYAMPTAHWAWSGQSGQPTWVWGGNDYQQYRVWNPSNFNVDSSRYLRASIGNYNAGGLFYGNSNDSVDGSGSWTNWIQFGGSGDWHSRLSFPYWSYPRYTRYYADSGTYANWSIIHSTENVKIQSSQPTGEFYGQIWLKI